MVRFDAAFIHTTLQTMSGFVAVLLAPPVVLLSYFFKGPESDFEVSVFSFAVITEQDKLHLSLQHIQQNEHL